MPARKIKCTFKDCKDAAQRIAGDCAFCQGHFCGKHRLLEDHKCDGLEDVSTSEPANKRSGISLCAPALVDESQTNKLVQCKKEAHEQNAAQLEAERTHVIKGV